MSKVHRSASSGRFVKASTAARQPRTTVTQSKPGKATGKPVGHFGPVREGVHGEAPSEHDDHRGLVTGRWSVAVNSEERLNEGLC